MFIDVTAVGVVGLAGLALYGIIGITVGLRQARGAHRATDITLGVNDHRYARHHESNALVGVFWGIVMAAPWWILLAAAICEWRNR